MNEKTIKLQLTGKSKIQFYSEGSQIDFVKNPINVSVYFDGASKPENELDSPVHIINNNQKKKCCF